MKFKDLIGRGLLLLHDFAISYLVLNFSIYLKNILGEFGVFNVKPGVNDYFSQIWWVSFFLILMFFIKGLYCKRLPFWTETREIVLSVFFTILLCFSVIYLKKTINFPRAILILYFFFIIFILPISRYFFKLFLCKISIYSKDVIILGAGVAGKTVVQGLLYNRELGFNVIGFLDDNKLGKYITINGNKYNVLGKIRDFKKIIKEKNIDSVVIAMPSLGRERLAELAAEVQCFVRRLYIVPEMRGISISNSELYHLFEEQLFLLKINNNLQSLKNKMVKRLFDLTMGICLLPFLIPLILIIGVMIKLDSEGNVFFSHTRVGKKGKKIKVLKFRTMYKDAQDRLKKILEEDERARREWESTFKLKNDPRVTRIGQFLRKTSLDELPQIFNVLKGDLSFVGPRPVVEEEIKKYYKENARFYYMVMPGITGLWQVSGRSNTDYSYRVQLDTWYVLNWSLWLDVVILFKTIKVVLTKDGAY
ncbi:undecaprenyl-phosphate galactose phosphotransferase WbaP [Desulfothermus naphthae]